MFSILFKAAGTDTQLLARCGPGERMRHGAMGFMILVVSALSGVSLAYAFLVIFTSHPYSYEPVQTAFGALAGVLWFMLIYNLHRLVVSSTGYGDGLSKVAFGEVGSALPKLLLSAIFGAVTGTTTTVVLLSPDLLGRDSIQQRASISSYNDSINSRYAHKLSALYEERVAVRAETRRIQALLASSSSARRDSVLNYPKRLEELNARGQGIDTVIQSLRKEMNTLKSGYEMSVRRKAGFVGDIQKALEYHVYMLGLINAFFIILFVLPILTRMLWAKGEYDYLREFQDKIVMRRHGIVDTAHQLNRQKSPFWKTRYLAAEAILAQSRGLYTARRAELQRHLRQQHDQRHTRITDRLATQNHTGAD